MGKIGCEHHQGLGGKVIEDAKSRSRATTASTISVPTASKHSLELAKINFRCGDDWGAVLLDINTSVFLLPPLCTELLSQVGKETQKLIALGSDNTQTLLQLLDASA
jgi:hypothetical protein